MKQFVVKDVCTQVKNDQLIDDISFHIDQGEIMALVGHIFEVGGIWSDNIVSSSAHLFHDE